MRDVFIAGVASSTPVEAYLGNEVELVQPVIRAALDDAGVSPQEVQFTTASSSDSFAGQAFAFVRMLDASGAYPAIEDSHLDMDGAWALYEAWVRLQVGDIDTALVFALGRSSSGAVEHISPFTLDPYYLAPLGLDSHASAALHASRLLGDGIVSRQDLDAIVARSETHAESRDDRVEALAYRASLLTKRSGVQPLTVRDLPTPTDAAAAVVLTTRPTGSSPVRLRAMEHRTDAHQPGVRTTTTSPSFQGALEAVAVRGEEVDIVELHARYPHEHALLAQLLGGDSTDWLSNDGGALISDPVMATGLVRHIEAARRLRSGEGTTALAHATAGPALQQNLISILEVVS